MRITIPKDDNEAREMADLAALSGWALAGYVASQVSLNAEGQGTRSDLGRTSVTSDRSLSPREFAAKGLRGLRSKNTVQLYAQRWRDYVGRPPVPGQEIDIPDIDWPPPPPAGKTPATNTRAAKSAAEAKTVAAAIVSNPAAAKAAVQALVSTRKGNDAINKERKERIRTKANEDPAARERLEKSEEVIKQAIADDVELTRITTRRNLLTIDIWIKEWARIGDAHALDQVGLMLDEVRGVIAEQAQALTPEMFVDGDENGDENSDGGENHDRNIQG